MYLAELHGKLSSNVERKEDILTSNVFSFFKYSDRNVYLKELMKLLEIEVNDIDLETADFLFWPNYDDNTQPDLVIILGNYYLLWEAKYFSDFEKKEVKTESQIIREIIGGLHEAKTIGKEFYFIAITADYIHDPYIVNKLPEEYSEYYKWLNWQSIAFLLLKLLELYGTKLPNFDFAQDLYDLLDKKKLRNFLSFERFEGIYVFETFDKVFFSTQSARFRGKFIGFNEALAGVHLNEPGKEIFYQSTRFRDKFLGFSNALAGLHVNKPDRRIFLQRNYFQSLRHYIFKTIETIFYERRV